MSYVERAKSVMRRHAENPLPISAIADGLGISAPYFSRLFTASEGVSPSVFYLRVRLEHAAGRLCEGAALIDVALDHGFESQQTFTRAFKSVFGIPPGQFRKINSREGKMTETDVQVRMNTPILLRVPASKYVGRSVRIGASPGSSPEQAWRQLDGRDTIAGEVSGHSYGICFDAAEDGSHVYMAAVRAAMSDDESLGWDTIIIPEQVYLSIEQWMPRYDFVSHLKAGLEEIWVRILPASGFEVSPGPVIEVYPDALVAGQTEGWLTHLVPISASN